MFRTFELSDIPTFLFPQFTDLYLSPMKGTPQLENSVNYIIKADLRSLISHDFYASSLTINLSREKPASRIQELSLNNTSIASLRFAPETHPNT